MWSALSIKFLSFSLAHACTLSNSDCTQAKVEAALDKYCNGKELTQKHKKMVREA
jgi:hypothetical protein